MKKLKLNMVALALGCAFSTGALAENIPKNDYRAGGNKAVEARKAAVASTLESQYAEEKKKCETYSGSDKVFCLDQAKARFGRP